MKKIVQVATFVEVEVEVDEAKFTPEFMAEFRESFYPFYRVEDHVGHLARLAARDLLQPFTEGYGNIKDFGIVATVISSETDIIS